MIRFEVTGETWAEIVAKLDGMFPRDDINIKVPKSVIDTVEEPEDSFKEEVKREDKKLAAFKKEPEQTVLPEVTKPAPIPETPIKKPIGRPPASAIDKYKLPFGPLDNANQPWDKAIHTRTKSKTDDGRWRLKRETPGFATREDSKPLPVQPPATAVPPAIPDFTQPVVTTPPVDTQPPASVIDTQQKMIAYLTKINGSDKGTFDKIAQYFKTQGIVNILHVPAEKLPEVAEKLKTEFGVDY